MPTMSTTKTPAQKAILNHATDCVVKADNADKELTAALLALIGCHQSVTGQDEIDLSDEDVFADPRDCNTEDDYIDRIGENDEGELVVFVNGDEEYELNFDDLILETRIELVQIIRERITKF
jgi:hypothetical protein